MREMFGVLFSTDVVYFYWSEDNLRKMSFSIKHDSFLSNYCVRLILTKKRTGKEKQVSEWFSDNIYVQQPNKKQLHKQHLILTYCALELSWELSWNTILRKHLYVKKIIQWLCRKHAWNYTHIKINITSKTNWLKVLQF